MLQQMLANYSSFFKQFPILVSWKFGLKETLILVLLKKNQNQRTFGSKFLENLERIDNFHKIRNKESIVDYRRLFEWFLDLFRAMVTYQN
jgi:CRISPR/Cas system CMR-associated protein Cmr5 small subunit